MRYHWGLGIGHVYAHESKVQERSEVFSCEEEDTDAMNNDDSTDRVDQTAGHAQDMLRYNDNNNDDDDNVEFDMGIGDDEKDFSDHSDQSSSGSDLDWDEENDEECLELLDSYHTDY